MSGTEVYRRGVAATWSSIVRPGMTPSHRVRPLVQDGEFAKRDPFLFLMEDWFGPHVFEDHPHRGIETVTYSIEGELEHRERGRNGGVFGPGDAMWMTAGRGVIHNEAPVGAQNVHTLQLWLNLPAKDKMTAPRFQILKGGERPVRKVRGGEIRVFSGESGGVASATLNHVPVTMVEFRLGPNAEAVQDLPASYNGFLYVLEGAGLFGAERTPAAASEIVWMEMPSGAGGSEFAVATEDKPLRALLWAGEPLHEPVVAYGPFVMNTQQQIREVFADYRAGRLG